MRLIIRGIFSAGLKYSWEKPPAGMPHPASDHALMKVAGYMAGNTVMDPAGTRYIEFGYDAKFTSNADGVTKVQGTFTARDKTIIRSGTIRGG